MKSPKKSRLVARTWPLWWVDCCVCDQRFRWEWGWAVVVARRWRCICSTCAPTEAVALELIGPRLPKPPAPPPPPRPFTGSKAKPSVTVPVAPIPSQRIMDMIEVVDSPRPEPEDEDRVITAAYREALERIRDAIGMPGSPDLTADVPDMVERLHETWKHGLAS